MRTTSPFSRSYARSVLLALATCAGLAALGTGCSASLREGAYGCGDGRCPSGWFCRADRRCYSTPEGLDAGPVDAPRLDATTSDAPNPDAPTRDAPQSDAGIVDAPTSDVPPAICSTGDGSACTLSAGGGGMCCGGACIDVTSDAIHCGNCTTRCAAPMMCLGSECRACTTAAHCNDGVACTNDACDGGGNCVHVPDDTLCTLPTPPATGATDCLLASTCQLGGCAGSFLDDGFACRDRGSRYLCGCSHVCHDTNSLCGTMVATCCSILSACEEAVCADDDVNRPCDPNC